MTRKIDIFDTTLRDGQQAPGASMMPDDKIAIARQLVRLNVDVIEAGFPVSSPGEFEAVRRIAQEVGEAVVVCALTRAVEADIDAAAEALQCAARPRIQTGIGVSGIHLREKLRISEDECLDRIRASVTYARGLCDSVQFYAEDAARADRVFLARACQEALRAGAAVINIPDTTGYALPDEYGARIAYLFEQVDGLDEARVSVHCHNDLGLACALSLAGVAAGATQVDCTINGLGERAGNCALEELVMAIQVHGEELDAHTDVQTRELVRASRLVSSTTGMRVQANKAIVGANAFAHSSGIHQDGMLKNASTYQIIEPETVGAASSQIVLTARSGRSALEHRLEEMGYALEGDALEALYESFLELADRKREVFDEDLESLVGEMGRSANAIFTLEGLQVSTGFPLTPTVTLTLADEQGVQHTVATTGDGPINAAYDAVNSIIGVDNELLEFDISAVTRGTDAIGEVCVRISDAQGRVFTGRGADPDIIVSSVKAYLDALNRLIISSRS